MSRLLLVILAALAIALSGCGQKPEEGGNATDSTAVEPTTEIQLDVPDIAVGQWVTYTVTGEGESQSATISVVAQESFQGADCYWFQFETPEGDVMQVLIDPLLLTSSLEQLGATMNEVLADPQAYYAAHTPDPSQMMNDPENIQKFMDFLSAVKVIKVMQNNAITAYDISGVPAVLQPVLSDTAFMNQMTAGMSMEMQAPEADSIQALLNEFEYAIADGQATVGETGVEGTVVTMTHPKAVIEMMLSGNLPILPVVYARVTEVETGKIYSIEATGFGMDGAENKLAGEPVQTMDMAPMIQMMIQQAQAQVPQQQ